MIVLRRRDIIIVIPYDIVHAGDPNATTRRDVSNAGCGHFLLKYCNYHRGCPDGL
jgi:hypothetical protein